MHNRYLVSVRLQLTTIQSHAGLTRCKVVPEMLPSLRQSCQLAEAGHGTSHGQSGVPSLHSVPTLRSVPTFPNAPTAPTVLTAPTAPTSPAAPTACTLPAVPGLPVLSSLQPREGP